MSVSIQLNQLFKLAILSASLDCKKLIPFQWKMAGKEYSKGDSRYAGRHSIVVSIEGVTAVLEGPFCLLTLYVYNSTILNSSLHSYSTLFYMTSLQITV